MVASPHCIAPSLLSILMISTQYQAFSLFSNSPLIFDKNRTVARRLSLNILWLCGATEITNSEIFVKRLIDSKCSGVICLPLSASNFP